MDLEAKVNQALANAKQNDFLFENYTIEEIAEDLKTYDADLEKVDVKTLLPLVRKWRLSNEK